MNTRIENYAARFQSELDEQRLQWDAVAEGWEKWWGFIEQSAQAVSDLLIDRACIGAGHRVLDLATGIGEPAISAARKVGPWGQVIATDQSHGMLAIGRRRAEELSLGNIDFHLTDGREVDLSPASLDAVLCRWGLMFFPEPSRALKDMHRLLRPGGQAAFAVWAGPQEVPMISLPMRVLGEALGLPRPPVGKPGPFALADKKRLKEALAAAGFSAPVIETAVIDVVFDSPAQYTEMLVDVVAPVQRIIAGQPAERKSELLGLVEHAAQKFARTDGKIALPCTAIVASGRKPLA